jgi:pimeloyl-ACP methyl ester carboxylesterase
MVSSVALESAIVRRLSFGDIARHGNHLTRAQAIEMIDDVRGCDVAADLLGTPELVAPLDPLPCPVTLAWSQCDKVFPVAVNGAIARERIPKAEFVVLPDVGHVPMVDDPHLVATTIRRSIC